MFSSVSTSTSAPLFAASCCSCDCWTSPLTWGLVCGALWLLLKIPRAVKTNRWTTALGLVLALATPTLIGFGIPCLGTAPEMVVFYTLAIITVGSAAAAIAMRSAVYAAIWFAMSLVGTAGIFLLQGAQFMGVATIVVYAGAIVVTLLFVVMLAQPDGHDTYDRIGWGWAAKPVSVGAALLMVFILALALSNVKEGKIVSRAKDDKNATPNVVAQSEAHMAHLGAELFSRHLVSVEVAGTLLMVALVGAIAIVIQGKDQPYSANLPPGGKP